jgi:DNA-binding IscR family transcriptional regulator
MELTLPTLQNLVHPEKARVLIHLEEHGGEAPFRLAEHLEIPLSTLYRYLADLESAGLVRPEPTEGGKALFVMPFEFRLTVDTLRRALEVPVDLPVAYRTRLGARRWRRLLEAANRASRGEITLRQAARKVGIRYPEFVALYHALGPTLDKGDTSRG